MIGQNVFYELSGYLASDMHLGTGIDRVGDGELKIKANKVDFLTTSLTVIQFGLTLYR